MDCRLALIAVSRGLLGQPPGLYPDEVLSDWQARLPKLEVTRLPDLNHYTVVMSPAGAALVAAKIKVILDRPAAEA